MPIELVNFVQLVIDGYIRPWDGWMECIIIDSEVSGLYIAEYGAGNIETSFTSLLHMAIDGKHIFCKWHNV